MTTVDVGTAKQIYTAGQVAEDISLDISGWTRQVLGFIDQLLERAGASRKDIVSVRILLASIGAYAELNSVWDEWVMPGHAPARCTVGATLINRAMR